jgi:MYXO-CTERM domain-containing protein
MSAPSAPSSDQLRAWSGISSALPQQQIIVYPPGPQDFFVGSAALALALPSQDDAAAWATGAPVVQAAIGTQGRVLAIGGFSGSGASPSQSGELHVTLTPGTVAGGEELSLGFVGLDTTGAGFSVLHVDVQLNELIVFDGTFHSPAEASADLDDAVKAIASGEFLSQSLVQLVLGYDVEIAAAADHFTEKFALFATPEPGCPLLAALVLVALAARRRRESGG